MVCTKSTMRDAVSTSQYIPPALVPPLKKGGRGDLLWPLTHLLQVLGFRRDGKSDGNALAHEFSLVLALHLMSARP